ncbi:MAG: TetR/AcrR family transcriptional regulator [Steroidobacteraceae bacterium]
MKAQRAELDEREDQDERFPRRSARRIRTRAKILEAALAHFQKAGYADATLNAIADAADVHVTTLFTHFKTKRDLATSLADAEIERLAGLIGAAKGRRAFFDFFRALVLTTAASRQKFGDHKSGIRQELQQDPELALSWLRYEEKEVLLLADYIAHDYGLDLKADYVPYLAASIIISSGVISYTRWRSLKGLDLVQETEVALDYAERMARAILPLRPLRP